MTKNIRLVGPDGLTGNLPRLADALEPFPLAVGLFNAAGRFVLRSGGLRSVLGEVIAPRDPQRAQRWRIFREDGAPVDPPDWPASRILRGEKAILGLPAVYHAGRGEQRWLRVSAAPFRDRGGFAGGVALVHDVEPERRAKEKLRDELEQRFVDALIGAIRAVCRDGAFGEAGAARALIGRTLGFPVANDRVSPDGLSDRESDVLRRIAWGKSQKEIAAGLAISVKTVEFHRRRAMEKLHICNRTAIVRYALSQGWFAEEMPD